MPKRRMLLDTDVCIDSLRARSKIHLWELFEPWQLYVSAVTFGELLHGAALRQAKTKVATFVAGLAGVLPIGEPEAQLYGDAIAMLQAKGKTGGQNDIWIAATAIANEMPLVTRNIRHFRDIPGLKILTLEQAAGVDQ